MTPILHTWVAGTLGPLLVFFPGLGGTTRYFEKHLGCLPKSHHVLIVDPLGFGDSPKPWTRYTVDRHMAELHQTLNGKGVFTLVGHSMGALLALAYAARHPEQVERLVLLSIPYFGAPDEAMRFFRTGPVLYRLYLTNMALAALICIVTRRIFAGLVPYFQPDLPREISADIVKHTWRSFTSSFWEVVCHYDAGRDADALAGRIPVLCLHGDHDQSAPLEGALKLARGRPNWQMRILPGVDHHPLLHASEVCQQAIARPIGLCLSEGEKRRAAYYSDWISQLTGS